MRQLRDKTALVTGAAGGIGEQVARELARHGTHLVLVDVDQAGLERVRQAVLQQGVRCTALTCNLADRHAISALTSHVRHDLGGVDVLVNNAGITFHGRTEWMTWEQCDQILQVNLLAAMQVTIELLPSLLARREAHIVNMCSVLGLIGLPRVCAYSTSKFGLVGFTEALRAEYGQQGIGVTAVCPGLVNTGLFRDGLLPSYVRQAKVPPRWACTTPEAVARATVRGIVRNRRQVVIEPLGRTLAFLKRWMPNFVDMALHMGRRRITARRLAQHAPPAPNVERKAA